MRAGLKIEIESSTPCAIASLLERENLGVLQTVVGVEASANNITFRVNDHCSDARIWRS
jgi:hypothetical protein